MGAKIIVLEIGRPVVDAVKAQLGEPFEVISYQRAISELEIPRIAKEAYNAIRRATADGSEVWLVLSGPLGLSFALGQLVGISHFRIICYQFSGGVYRPVPPPTRDLLF
jgi:hypothetical protein